MNKIDCKSFSNEYRMNIKYEIEELEAHPSLLIVSIGEYDSNMLYVRSKLNLAEQLGIKAEYKNFDALMGEELIIETLIDMDGETGYDGIIVQIPCDKNINAQRVINATISEDQDVDCLTWQCQGRMYMNDPLYLPATVRGTQKLIESIYPDGLSGKKAIVVGRSNIVGKPTAEMLERMNAEVTLAHSKCKLNKGTFKDKDVVVLATDKPNLINGDVLKDDAVVIDDGTTLVDGKCTGNFDTFTSFREDNIRYTPVPGGAGLLTTTALMENVLKAWKIHEGLITI